MVLAFFVPPSDSAPPSACQIALPGRSPLRRLSGPARCHAPPSCGPLERVAAAGGTARLFFLSALLYAAMLVLVLFVA